MSKRIKIHHKTTKGNTVMNEQANTTTTENTEAVTQEEIVTNTTEQTQEAEQVTETQEPVKEAEEVKEEVITESTKETTSMTQATATETTVTEEKTTSAQEETPAAPVINPPEVATIDQTAATPTPEAVSTKAEIVDTKNEVLTKFQQYAKDILTTGSEAEKNLVIGIEEYIARVAPGKPVEPTEGVNAQRSLLELIRAVTYTTDKTLFAKLWKILIAYFAEHSGNYQVFHEGYINRFTEHWSTGPAQLDAFRNITHLLRVTAEHKSTNYKNLESVVAIDRVLNSYFSEQARNNVIGFYRK